MSDVIPKPGKYKQQNGKPADVKWVGEGKALGFDSNGEGTEWKADSGRWVEADCEHFFCHIVSPWIPDPPEPQFKVGDHVRVKNDSNEHPCARGKVGVVGNHWNHENGWVSVRCEGISTELGFLLACGNLEAADPPKPAVDPGEGWRLLGDEESPQLGDEFGFREYVSCGNNWLKYNTDDYHFGKTLKRIREFQGDDFFVRRRVIPQPEWTPTNEMRLAKTVFDDPLGTWYGKGVESQWLRIEQRWTNGTDSEWRPVTVEGA